MMGEIVAVATLAFWQAVDLLPWFMLAILLGVAVRLLSLDVIARRVFRRHGLLAILATASIGAFSPFCSFTVIPLIRKFLTVGVPLSAVMAFWIASPSMSPELFAFTAAQLGIPMAVARLIGALTLSLGAAFLVKLLEARGWIHVALREERQERATASSCSAATEPAPAVVTAQPALAMAAVGRSVSTAVLERPTTMETASSCGDSPAPIASTCGEAPTNSSATASTCGAAASSCASAAVDEDDDGPWWPRVAAELRTIDVRAVGREVLDDTSSLGRWLLVAVVFEALIVRYVPRDIVANTIGTSGGLAVPLSALLSIPLYLNGISAVPIVAGLMAKGMMHGAGITFLLAGSVTTIPAMAAVWYVVRSRVFLFYVGVSLLGSMLIGLIANYFLY